MTIDGHLRGEVAMSAEVSVAQAKARFAALVARAEKGEHIVVTRNGRPVACLGPMPQHRPMRYGDLAHLWIADDLSLPEEIIAAFEPNEAQR
jgi:prevent-host-death family protein